MTRVRRGVTVAITVVLLCGAGTLGTLLAAGHEDRAARAAPGLRADLLPASLDGAAAPRVALRDARGGVLDTARLRRPYLLTFLYTHCVDVCPLIGSEIADALDRLGGRARDVAALGVSVDPRGDTPAAARRWTAEHRLGPSFHYLVGSRARLTPVWRDWYVVPRDGTLADPRGHDASVWLIDARGRLRGRWSGGAPIAPADLAHDLGRLLDEARQGAG